MSKWFEVWGEEGWKKKRAISDLKESDVFRVMSDAMTGACLVVESVVRSGMSVVMKSRVLNHGLTVVCVNCEARLDSQAHGNKVCPICGGNELIGSMEKPNQGLVVRQQKSVQSNGVFH